MVKIGYTTSRERSRGIDELGFGPAKVQGASSISVQVEQSGKHLGRRI